MLPLFAGRVLAFDLPASPAYAELMASARTAGFGIGAADGYIAPTATSNRMSVATRDTAPFEAVGVPVINPWQALNPQRGIGRTAPPAAPSTADRSGGPEA